MTNLHSYRDFSGEQKSAFSWQKISSATLGLVTLGLVGGLGYAAFGFGLFEAAPQIDKATGCRLDKHPVHTTAALIDATDVLTPLHLTRVKNRLNATALSMPDYGKLIVVLLNPADATAPQEIFARCAPRAPERTSQLEGGADYVRREWTENFLNPLLASINDLGSAKPAARSPIIATIAGLTQRPDFDGEVADRRLVIISDMLEFEPAKGGYKHVAGVDFLKAYQRSALATQTKAQLQNVPVVIDYLQRPNQARVQTDAHRSFWRVWFTEAGARDVAFFGVRDALAANKDAQIPKSQKAMRN
jgi:hypothetical protein